MRSYIADYNLFAASARLKESTINTVQTMDATFQIDKGNVIQLVPRREANDDALLGHIEADLIYNLGALSEMSIDFNRAEAQHFGFLLAYGLGSVVNSANGTGYTHTITPMDPGQPPTFTTAMRMGKTMFKRRFAGCAVESLSAVFAKDSWAKISGTIKGTGKNDVNMVEESVTAAYNATTLTLAANGVQGATAAERLDSVHKIRVLDTTSSYWKDVVFTAVSAATPAVITFNAPGGVATSTTYKILYAPIEAAWASFPARIDQTPLRVTDLTLTVGGKWVTTQILGGYTLSDEIESIEYSLDNTLEVAYRVGGTGTYANWVLLKDRVQTLKVNRQLRDYFIQNYIDQNEYFAVKMKAQGATFDTGRYFTCELNFPRCMVLTAPIAVNDKIVAEAGDIRVLYDATAGFSTQAIVMDTIATYAS